MTQWLEAHNIEGERHDALALEWSNGLSLAAARWTDKYQRRHTRREIVERQDPNASDLKPSHWTQALWKSMALIGSTMTVCVLLDNLPYARKRSIDFYACEHYALGNYRHQHGKNVKQ
ncbi:hypothetical protein DL96DRAFT_1562273 [Flagelloscypha sp. PMI_526]|nr:hypothetical protein DL96DRAFT_1562273 [Flagelloscypha sp. PMI_526]